MSQAMYLCFSYFIWCRIPVVMLRFAINYTNIYKDMNRPILRVSFSNETLHLGDNSYLQF